MSRPTNNRTLLEVVELEPRDQPALLGLSVNLPLIHLSVLLPASGSVHSLVSHGSISAVSRANAVLSAPATAMTPAHNLVQMIADDTASTISVTEVVTGSIGHTSPALRTPAVFRAIQTVSQTIIPSIVPADTSASVGLVSSVSSVPVNASSSDFSTGSTVPPRAVEVSASVNANGGAFNGTVDSLPSIPSTGNKPPAPATARVSATSVPGTPVAGPVSAPVAAAVAAPTSGTTSATVPVIGTTPFVIIPGTPAFNGGGPTGGTGTVVTAAGAVSAGTAVMPAAAASPATTIQGGTGTGVLLLPAAAEKPSADPEAGGQPDEVPLKAGLPNPGVHWDGFALALVAAVYGLWHWKRQPRLAIQRALRLALDATKLN